MEQDHAISASGATEIQIRRSNVHNLKDLTVSIPRGRLVVITGVSGSGKSSLAFDTLYAEGQRRYVESLSSYARQFLGRMEKPAVESIKGISPAIAIEQKVNSRNPRSTVGTSTEIYEYLKLLFARIGKTYSPVSQKEVKRHRVSHVMEYLGSLALETRVILLAPVELPRGRTVKDALEIILQQGFSRVKINGEILEIPQMLEEVNRYKANKKFSLVVDRLKVHHHDKAWENRVSDSVEMAFYEGQGRCKLEVFENGQSIHKYFSGNFEMDGIRFEEPDPNLFSFNNPYGACPECEGYGSVIGVDQDLVVPDKSLSLYDNAVAAWRGEKMRKWKDKVVHNAHKADFPVHTPIGELSADDRRKLWEGTIHFKGINDFFSYVERKAYKIQYRVMLSRYRGRTTCPHCQGTRLRQEAGYVKVGGKSVKDLVLMPVDALLAFFNKLTLSDHDITVARRLLVEVTNRLQYLCDVGLGYLTLNRLSSSLSGGESQRINLATSLGSTLTGSMYILDEPSIGLHPRDNQRLIKVLKQLRDLGNTVIVVEHDEEIMKTADQLIDIGPGAGSLGGKLVAQGTWEEIVKNNKGVTAKYLSGKEQIAVPEVRRKWKDYIFIQGATQNNLKNVKVKVPLNVLTVVTGVSGSGKTSLIKDVLYTALKKAKGFNPGMTGKYKGISGDLHRIHGIELVSQAPIGQSSRSNPVTYVKAYDDIRALFASRPLAETRGYKPGYFSFNLDGGRCDACKGEGVVNIEMQFMADIELPCESCSGKRFKSEVLDVKYEEKSISDILELTVSDAIDLFGKHAGEKYQGRIVRKLKSLEEVGLGYVKLGQPSGTLSGGESQRIKLAFFLSRGHSEAPVFFIFDEPTTGLHFHDIKKLYASLESLIIKGHTVVVIEHHMDVIKCADWVIDLGYDGGENGGHIVFEGLPEDLVNCEASYTGRYLKAKL